MGESKWKVSIHLAVLVFGLSQVKLKTLFCNIKRVRLMCALRAHINFSIFGNIFLEIEKTVITFSILKKIFPQNGN